MQRDPVLEGSGEAGFVLLQQAIQGTLGGQLHYQHPRTNPSCQQGYQAGMVEVTKYHQLLQGARHNESQMIQDPSPACLPFSVIGFLGAAGLK